MVRCFSLGSVLILIAIAASMVVLPLMLPPLPPPPLVLLFFPVGIMAALVVLAFSPSENVKNVKNVVGYSSWNWTVDVDLCCILSFWNVRIGFWFGSFGWKIDSLLFFGFFFLISNINFWLRLRLLIWKEIV